ncbi:right-handed parallel beta-helix repeat-containing protein [Paracoccus simplex]|uniref:Right-handed parallel beta-helix repeat-containing protein n=1 Tax=Paracoccus simplex TaxID=2086346 RepID=A0ABV7RXN4_9RHOB
MAKIVRLRVSKRGPKGEGISEAQQEQVDAAIQAAEDLSVALPQVEQARSDAVTAAEDADGAANTASAAAGIATGAADTATAAAGQAANVGNAGAVLPDSFILGLQGWTSQRGGAPTAALPADKMAAVSDTIFGPAAQWNPTTAGDNMLTKGVVPWGKNSWRVTVTLRVLAPTSGTLALNIAAIGLNKDFGGALYTSLLSFAAPADGSEFTTSIIVSPFSDDGAPVSIVPPSSFANSRWVRFGVRAGGAASVVVSRIKTENADQELAQSRTQFAAIPFQSRAAAISAGIPSIVQSIRVFHDGEMLDYVRKPAAMATENIPLTTAGSQHWIPKDEATLRHWGAVADASLWTGTDCRTMLQSMIGWAVANNVRRVVVNAGNFLVVKNVGSGSTCVFNATNLEVVGRGMDASRIYFQDKGVSPEIKKGLFFRTTSTPAEFIRFADLSIISDWGVGGEWGESGQTIALGDLGGEFVMERVRIKDAANMAVIAKWCDRIRVTGCIFDTISRDGLHITNSDDVQVTGNYFYRVCDDSIAAVRNEANSLRENTLITDNIFVDSQGVYGIGSRNMRVSGNIFVRPTVRGVRLGMMRANDIGTGNPESGNIARYNIDVSDNLFIDGFGRSRWGGSGTTGYLIAISDAYGDSDSVTYSPAYALDTVDGTHYVWGADGSGGVVPPDEWWSAGGNYIGSVNVSVTGNKCLRTLLPTAAYTDYGFGPRYISGAPPYAGDVIESDFIRDHYWIGGTFHNAIVSGNLSFGARNPWRIWGFNNNAAQDFVNMIFRDNIVSNFYGSAAYNIDGFGVLDFEGGVVDGDPLHRHPLRGPNGVWTAAYGADAFAVRNASVRVKGGHFKNVTGLVNQVSGKHGFYAPVTISGHLEGLGDNPNNKGVRNVPANVPFDYARVGSDPSAADFGQVLGMTDRFGSTMPTTGHYIAGQIVSAPNPISGSGYIIDGWYRLTTGSGHVAGTDWREIRRTVS